MLALAAGTGLRDHPDRPLNTGIIRGMGANGRVVIAAGVVFAFTMMLMIVSDLRVVGQLCTGHRDGSHR